MNLRRNTRRALIATAGVAALAAPVLASPPAALQHPAAAPTVGPTAGPTASLIGVSSTGRPTGTPPVDLSAHIDMALGKAAAADRVVEGDARFELLGPDLVRLEYSPT